MNAKFSNEYPPRSISDKDAKVDVNRRNSASNAYLVSERSFATTAQVAKPGWRVFFT